MWKNFVRRNYYFRRGQYWDQIIVGITKADYINLIKENKYWGNEYKKGDRVAEFGLAALIVGGAAAVASKKGLWAALVALLVGAKKLAFALIIGLFAGIASLFRRKK